MEEDIKILKEVQWNCLHLRQYKDDKAERKAQAIENILNRLEQDERIIEEMAEYIHITQHCKVIFGGKKPVPYLKEDIIDHFRKKCE